MNLYLEMYGLWKLLLQFNKVHRIAHLRAIIKFPFLVKTLQ